VISPAARVGGSWREREVNNVPCQSWNCRMSALISFQFHRYLIVFGPLLVRWRRAIPLALPARLRCFNAALLIVFLRLPRRDIASLITSIATLFLPVA
jgi:hypothetical protein